MKLFKKMFVSLLGLGLGLSASAPIIETVSAQETVTIRVAYKDDGPSNENSVSYYNQLAANLLEAKGLDVQFELVELAQGDYSEKLSLLLNSGDIPDLIYFQGGDQAISEQGLLEDLRPYIEESEYLKDIIQPHNVSRLENYPYLLWVKPIDYKVPVIRQDIVESLETGQAVLDNPTVENYKALFEEIVESGQADYAVTVAGNIVELDFIFNHAFGVTQEWLPTDEGYINSKVSEQEKNKLAFYHELYESGLLDNEYLTKQWDTKEDAFYNGQAAVVVGTNGKVVDFYNSRIKEVNGEEAGLVILPPAKGESQGFGSSDITKESRGLAISAISENKEIVFEILDYLASPEGQQFDRLGFEGTHYTIVDDKIELTDAYYGEWYSRYWEPVEMDFTLPISETTPMLSEPGQLSQELANEYFAENNAFILPQDMVAEIDAMNNLYREYSADIITGRLEIDAFDEFVEKWYEAGGSRLTEMANETVQ